MIFEPIQTLQKEQTLNQVQIQEELTSNTSEIRFVYQNCSTNLFKLLIQTPELRSRKN